MSKPEIIKTTFKTKSVPAGRCGYCGEQHDYVVVMVLHTVDGREIEDWPRCPHCQGC